MRYLKPNNVKQYIKAGILLMLALQSKASSVSEKTSVVPQGDSSPDFEGCSNLNSTLYCIQVWGPLHGYNPTPNEDVERECFTDENCCPDLKNTSVTGYDVCEWEGCEDVNSTAYCEVTAPSLNTTVDECFKDKDCCPVSQNTTNTTNSSTGYSICLPIPPTPRVSLAESTIFFIVESSVLLAALAGTGAAYKKGGWPKTLKGGIAMISVSACALLGTGIAALVDKEFKLTGDSSSLHLAFTGGVVLGASLFAKGYYDLVVRQNAGPGAVALLGGGGGGGGAINAQPVVSCCNCIIS